MSRIFWGDEEYLALARGLIEEYPSAHYEQARTEEDLYAAGFGMAELRWVMQRKLPPEMQRDLKHLQYTRPALLSALAVLRGDPVARPFSRRNAGVEIERSAPSQAGKEEGRAGQVHVRWTDAEWDDFARRLALKEPRLLDNLDYLSIRHLNEVGALMGRPRAFNAVGLAKKGLEPALARLKAAGGLRFVRAPSPDAAPASIDRPIMDRTVSDAEMQKKADEVLNRKIVWSRSEWLDLARELDRMFPIHKYADRVHNGGDLTGLDSQDVAFAQQKVLPFERQRRHLKVVSFSQMRPMLLQAFRDLHAEKASEAARAAEEARREELRNREIAELASRATPSPTGAPHDLHAAPEPQVERKLVFTGLNVAAGGKPVRVEGPPPGLLTPTQQAQWDALPGDPQTAPLVGTPSGAIDPLRLALNTIAQTFAGALVEALRPLVQETVERVLEERPDPVASRVLEQVAEQAVRANPDKFMAALDKVTTPAPSAAPDQFAQTVQQLASGNLPDPNDPYLSLNEKKALEAAKVVKPVVGVMCNRPEQVERDLSAEFPGIEFRAIPSVRAKLAQLEKADKITAMQKFVDHDNWRRLKDMAGDRFVNCTGGMSEVKRIVQMWIAAGELKPAGAHAKAA